MPIPVLSKLLGHTDPGFTASRYLRAEIDLAAKQPGDAARRSGVGMSGGDAAAAHAQAHAHAHARSFD